MALKPASSMALLLPLLLLLACELNLVLASSGGVMGGHSFHSGSSFSHSSRSNSALFMTRHSKEAPSPSNADYKHDAYGEIVLILILMLIVLFVMIYVIANSVDTYEKNAITLCKIQVAFSGGNMGSSIQSDLTRIAKGADTSSREGVIHLLTETIQALDRQFSYCIAGYSSVDLKRSKEDGKKCYDQLSKEERGKFDEETLVNLNNVKRTSVNVFSNEDKLWNVKERINESQNLEEELLNGFGNEYIALDIKESEEEELLNGVGNKFIVVTILMTIKGAHQLPNQNGAEDLKKALQKLRSLLLYFLAGEVLWTPQKDGETISGRKLLEDYPHLVKCIKSFKVKKEE